MRERELEQVMSDFYHKRFNVLVASTIIETGIDVPSANTIIIERADKLGLAQLHQLRGRVGRLARHEAVHEGVGEQTKRRVRPRLASALDGDAREDAAEAVPESSVWLRWFRLVSVDFGFTAMTQGFGSNLCQSSRHSWSIPQS